MERIESKIPFDIETIEAGNLCGKLTARDQQLIAGLVWNGFTKDKQSRRKWEERNSAAMDLAMQIQQSKSFPWPNCSNVVFPLVSIAAIQFSTRSYSNLIRGTQIVQYKSYGMDGKKTPTAKLIGEHMSWQVLEEDSSWEEQHDRLFINVSIVGSAFIKTRYSPSENHNTSRLVMARDFVLDYFAPSVEAAARKTEVIRIYRNEIWERCQRGVYRDVREESWFKAPAQLQAVQDAGLADHDKRIGMDPPQSDLDTPFTCLEQHRWLDLDHDGYSEPYICLIESSSRALLRVVARVKRPEDVERDDAGEIISIKADESYTKYGFIPAPDGGIYDMGFGILLGPLNETVDTAINQIFDAGTMNMLGGGFAASGGKLKAGVYTRTPGEWKIVKGAADDLRKALVSFPEIPVSDVLFKVLQLVIQYADRLVGSTETMAGENPGQNTPAGTYQGMVEQGSQIYKSIFKRIWRSMKEEFKKLHKLNAYYLPQKQVFGVGEKTITQEMYKSDPDKIVPLADPNLVSDQQRIQRASLVRQAAHTVPGYNIEEAERDFLSALGVDDDQRVYPGPYSEWYQQHPLPNPKMQVEQVKMEGVKMKVEHDKWKTLVGIRKDQEKIRAEVEFIHAQAAALVAKVGAEKAAHQLEVFDTIMTHLSAMADTMNDRITALTSEGNENEANQPGGAGRTQGQPGGSSAVAVPAQAGGTPP